MLAAIRKLLTAKAGFRTVRSTPELAELEHNPSFVTSPGKILKLLKQVMAATPLCSVNLKHSDEVFYTSILQIQAEENLLIIDKISPAYGNSRLLETGEAKITALISGVPVVFEINLVNTNMTEKLDHFQAHIPTHIYHPQLRASPRIATASTAISFHGTIKTSGRLLKGYITDFSRGGVSITCSSLTDSLKRGDMLSSCQINLPGNQLLMFDLSVRTFKKASYLGQQRQIGGYFHNLSTQDQKTLDRYVSALERQQIRKLRKD